MYHGNIYIKKQVVKEKPAKEMKQEWWRKEPEENGVTKAKNRNF